MMLLRHKPYVTDSLTWLVACTRGADRLFEKHFLAAGRLNTGNEQKLVVATTHFGARLTVVFSLPLGS